MKRLLSLLTILLLLAGLFSGCGAKQPATPDAQKETDFFTDSDGDGTPDASGSAVLVEADFTKTDADMFTERDTKASYNEQDCILIQLNDTTAAAGDKSVLISGSTVTITEEGTYLVSGSLTDGSLVVNAPDTAKLQIIFRDVSITSASSAPLCILSADKVFLTLADGSQNTLTNGGSFAVTDEVNVDGTIFSRQDLTLNGTGSLTVTSPAGHGIVCKDDLVITGGSYSISSASHGIDANDSVRITGDASLSITAGKDGIHCEQTDDASLGFLYLSGGSLQITAEGDGLDASAYLQIVTTSLSVVAGGGHENGTKASSGGYGSFPFGNRTPGSPTDQTTTTESTSMKGLKATTGILIKDGDFSIDAADDTIHSNATVQISGGTFTLSSGDDGIHADTTLQISGGSIRVQASGDGLDANGSIEISGGVTIVTGPTTGDTATLDYDTSCSITGGTFIGTGAASMAQSFSSSTQGVIFVRGGTYAARRH